MSVGDALQTGSDMDGDRKICVGLGKALIEAETRHLDVALKTWEDCVRIGVVCSL